MQDFLKAMNIEPKLGITGIYAKDSAAYRAPHDIRLKEERERLKGNFIGFSHAVNFFSLCKKGRTFNDDIGSYGLKHRIETADVYVSNGALIAAAIHLQIRYKQIDKGSPNVYFAIPKRSLKQALKDFGCKDCKIY